MRAREAQAGVRSGPEKENGPLLLLDALLVSLGL